ncbi:MAG: P83/100 family protein [Spirochaetia bacterium]|jgi:hypothetical protein|nr:P83/100 family protein [Spirochaetia bacterium]
MKKGLILLLVSIVFTAMVSAETAVDRRELEKNYKEVEFINYEGPNEIIETKSEIMSIGQSLAGPISSGKVQSLIPGKYRVLHLLDPSEPDKMGADIFILEKGAKVDHIRNLRLIISAYLQDMYSYSSADSMLIAEFITYYNAVYRGNLDFFSERYINMVLTNISIENAGIDVNYINWPGKTRLVIPLEKPAATSEAASPDPFELAGKDVVEDLRKEEDMGIEQRKKIVEFQEESIAEGKEELAKKEIEASIAEKSITEKEKALEEKKKEISDSKLSESDKAVIIKELEAQEDKIEKEKEAFAAKKEEAETMKKDIEKKEEAISEAREKIAEDSNKLLEKKEAAKKDESLAAEMEKSAGTPFLRLEEGTLPRSGRFVFFSTLDKVVSVPAEAPVSAGRLYAETPAGFIIPVKESTGKYTLSLLGKKDLLPVKSASQEVWSGSYILLSGNDIYCTAKPAGSSTGWVVARFADNLEAKAFSEIEADPDTFIIKKDNLIIFQDKKGNIVSVDAASLK